MFDDDIDRDSIPDLIPASMLATFAFCPRLCYLQFVQGEFADSAELAEGRLEHRWIDAVQDPVPEGFQPFHARSVSLDAPRAGVCCRIDLLEGDGDSVIPVEYKRGEARPEGPYEPHLMQLAAQCLALRENGFSCREGMVYYIGSRERAAVAFDQALMDRARSLLSSLRLALERGETPPPLQASSRCDRCSLAGICLPDEVILLQQMQLEGMPRAEEGEVGEKNIRMLLPARDDAVPVYVVGQGKTVRKRGERLEVWAHDQGKINEARIRAVSQLCLYGGVEVTTAAMVELMNRGVPVLHFSHGGWFLGICQGMGHKNVLLRIKQFQWAGDEERSLSIARRMIYGKVNNCRYLLRKKGASANQQALSSLERIASEVEKAESQSSLLGLEGAAAEIYFQSLGASLKGDQGFSFQNRNRRPPMDPVNATLSYLYGILVKELFSTALAVGFDPYLGFYHQPRYGRPALALDLMEEFRPVIADTTAFSLLNNQELTAGDFIRTGIGISLTPQGKKKVIAGYERRIQTEIAHPIFGYKVSYRRTMEVQARLLARTVSGEIKEYPVFISR